MEFPDDRTTHHLDQQYMLGPSLLVAPVFVPLGEETEYYIPAGKWTYYWDRTRTVEGPIWIREHVPLDEIPVWVRPGTVLCTGPPGVGCPDYDYHQRLDVNAFGVEEGQVIEVKVPGKKGVGPVAVLHVKREGGKLSVSVAEGECQYNLVGA